jgi:hypothetical protein
MLREFGLAVPKGEAKLRRQLSQILEEAGNGLPALAREVLAGLLEQPAAASPFNAKNA